MIIEGYAATTHTDLQGMKMSLSVLREIEEAFNSKYSAVAIGFRHIRECAPLGKVISARVQKMDDGEYGVYIVQMTYDTFEEIEFEGEKYIEMSLCNDSRELKKNSKFEGQMRVAVNPLEFSSIESHETYLSKLNAEGINEIDSLLQKSADQINETTITITIELFKYLLLYKTSEKIIDKFSDDISELVRSFYHKVMMVIKSKVSKSDQYVLIIPGDYEIELITKSEDAEVVLESYSSESLMNIDLKLKQLESKFSISKVQFVFEENTGWKFNYIVTHTGSVIGKPIIINQSKDNMLKIEEMKGLSIGGTGVVK